MSFVARVVGHVRARLCVQWVQPYELVHVCHTWLDYISTRVLYYD